VIAQVTGVLTGRSGETIVLATDGGVGYEIRVPLGVLERLPANGARISLHTELVVREDGWSLYGFDRPVEREVFQKLLGASGFGPRLALALISALGGDRTVRSIRGRDLAALSSVPGIGRKKAERLVLELQDKLEEVVISAAPVMSLGPAEEAVRALIALGYAPAQADKAVQAAILDGHNDAPSLIRGALKALAPRG
jgi:Holliday junction DNA helicase RuvA